MAISATSLRRNPRLFAGLNVLPGASFIPSLLSHRATINSACSRAGSRRLRSCSRGHDFSLDFTPSRSAASRGPGHPLRRCEARPGRASRASSPRAAESGLCYARASGPHRSAGRVMRLSISARHHRAIPDGCTSTARSSLIGLSDRPPWHPLRDDPQARRRYSAPRCRPPPGVVP